MSAPQQIVKAIVACLINHPEVQCCYLYGSAATGAMATGSDVDIAVAGERELSPEEQIRLRDELEVATRRDIDLIDLRRASGTLLRNALRGQSLLCRNPGVRYELARRLVYDQEDMQPLRRGMMDRRRQAFAYGH